MPGKSMSGNREVRDAAVPGLAPEAALSRLAALARELGLDHAFEDANSLAERLMDGRFYVACVGQFKRGKSTLLNALLEDRILPTGVVPITMVPTVVRYGKSRAARVRLRETEWTEIVPEQLTHYVSQEHNPENSKGVTGVEVFCPSSLLANGMCFVDTPGLGSVFAGNTAATQEFIPHIDASMVVVGADPPIAGEELTLVEEVARQARDLVVVLNKADRVSDSDRQAAKDFTRRTLEKRLKRSVGFIYEISAQERVENRGPQRDWEKLTETLAKLVRESGRDLVRVAGARGLRRVSEQLLTIIGEERDALTRPLEESERRIQGLRLTITEAERSSRELGFLFTAEQRRLSDIFLDQRKEFLVEAMRQAMDEFEAALRRLSHHFGPRFRRDAMRAAQILAEKHVLPLLEKEEIRAEDEYREVAARFTRIANDFLERLSHSGGCEFARLPHALDSDKGFRVRSRFTFERLLNVSLPASPLRYVADSLLGLVGASFVIEREAKEFLQHLIDMNSARVQSDVVDRVAESRSRLEVEIRKTLHEVMRIAERAAENARKAKAEGAAVVEAALAQLDAIEFEIRSLHSTVDDRQ
jgi:predicted GTPase